MELAERAGGPRLAEPRDLELSRRDLGPPERELGANLSAPPAFCSSTESIARVRAAPATAVRVTVFERR